MTPKPTTHGGARKGAGRKKSGRSKYTFMLFPRTASELKRRAKALDTNPGQIIEGLVGPVP